MRVVDDSSFNSVLQKRLAHLQDRAKTLRPENINVLPFDPFNAENVESAVGPATEFRNAEFDDNMIVNSIRMGKIKSIIRFLKVNKQKYLMAEYIRIASFGYDFDNGYELVDSSGNGVIAAGNKVAINVSVPEGYDGRKAFPHYGLNYSWGFNTLNKFAYLMSLWINEQKEGTVGAEVVQNKERITFNFRVPKDGETVVFPNLTFEIFYWNSIL
jgi:hypothetical protein